MTSSGVMVGCTAELNCRVVADVTAENRKDAKLKAAIQTLQDLRKTCWTIQMKGAVDSDASSLSKDEIMGEVNKKSESIGDDNIGNQLLRKMGWTGGGVGATGNKGIAEPVSVSMVINRQGLGLLGEQGISANLLPNIKTTILDYMRSNSEEDLTFSPDFTKEERALIHKEAQKLGLKTHSHGSGNNRYLAVSRKRTARQLFSYVMQSGGETAKYELLPPGSVIMS